MKHVLFVISTLLIMALYSCQTEQVKLTDSGYEYVTCVDLEGNPASEGDFVFVHAKLFAGDSLLFDTREQGEATPLQMPTANTPRGQLAPLLDVVALMSIGDSMRFDYPLDSFKAQRPQVEPGVEHVTYDIVVTDIMTPDAFQTWRANQMRKNEERYADIAEFVEGVFRDYKAGALDDQIRFTDSGLGYVVHEAGVDQPAEKGQVVDAQYYGILASDGEMFDNSFQRGQPFTFQVGMGMVIPGWDEGFQLFGPGTKATLFIPSELGYGDRASGPIPANSDLIFYIEVQNVR